MSQLGVDALRAGHLDVLAVARTLTDDEWVQPSDCEGWRVQDVVTHMANTFRTVVDPSSLAPGVSGDLEATQATQAEANRDWSPDKVLTDYEAVAAQGLEMIAGFQNPGMAELVVPMEDAGHYPLHFVANALAFDHFRHLRNDILGPHGPIDREVPNPDATRLGGTIEWLLAGLPQMRPDRIQAVLTAPLGVRLTGPGSGEWTIEPAGGDGGTIDVVEGLASDRQATVTTPAAEFVIWSTARRPWRDRDVQLDADTDYAGKVLDTIRLF